MKHGNKGYAAGRILLNVSRIVSSSLDLDKTSDIILREAAYALRADHGSLFLEDEKSGHLILFRAIGFAEDEIANIKLLGSWEVINDQLVKRKSPLVVNNVASDPVFKKKNLPFAREHIPIRSFLAVPLKKDDKVFGILIVSNRKKSNRLFTKDDEKFLLALSNYIAIALVNAKLYQRLKDLFMSTVKSLVRAVDAKDRYTSGHSERVMKYAMSIGEELDLSGEDMENLKLSGLLHDVGKIGVKESVLSKPGDLSPLERDEIKCHPYIGSEIVESIDDSHKIIRGILEHHERFDGKGYPSCLKGAEISMQGRIIAVADAFDALTTDRPYSKRYTPKEAFFEIKNNSSSHFDPKVVKAFIKSFSKHPQIWL